MKRKWDVSSDQIRQKCLAEIIARVDEQDGATFGLIAANDIVDIVLQNLAPDIYNMALKDAKKLIQDRLSDLEVDLDLLDSSS